MRSALGALGLSVMLFLSAAGQQRPNFSGTWEETGSRYRETILRIDHHDSSIRIESTMRELPGPPTTIRAPMFSNYEDATYNIEGPEKTVKNEKSQAWLSVFWQENSLVIERVRKENYRVTVSRDAWTLSDDGDTLTKAHRTVNMDGITETTSVYYKK